MPLQSLETSHTQLGGVRQPDMPEPGAVSLEQSQGQVVQLLLLTESDEELLAQLGVEKDLFFFELQFWLSSVGPDRGTEGGDVVTDVVNTGFLNIA